MHGPESDNMIAPQLGGRAWIWRAQVQAQTAEWRVSEHNRGRGQFDAGISVSAASLRHAACCCMLLHVAACCFFLHAAACCCLLLHLHCMLLHVAACCCMLLHAAACCCMLLLIALCCCMCTADGEVTRGVQFILRQGQICNTENWLTPALGFGNGKGWKYHPYFQTIVAIMLFSRCPSCVLVFTSPHSSENWQKSSQPSQLSPGSES